MAKSPRKPRVAKAGAQLASAVQFLAPAVKDYVFLGPKHIEAYNGVLSIGVSLDTGIDRMCPNFEILKRALNRCGAEISITAIDKHKLSIVSGSFRAVVPCLDEEQVLLADQNEKLYPATEKMKEGLQLLNPLVKEAGVTMVEASLLLQSETMVATDRTMIMEFRHAIEKFPTVVVPKVFIAAVAAHKEELVGFGYGQIKDTITFYFKDDSWIQTQLYADPWPDISRIFAENTGPEVPIPEGFFDAVSALIDFSDDNEVIFGSDSLRSHDDLTQGASYELPGANLPPHMRFNAKKLAAFENVATTIVWPTSPKARGIVFYGGTPATSMIRGAVAMRHRSADPIAALAPEPIEPADEIAPEAVAEIQARADTYRSAPAPEASISAWPDDIEEAAPTWLDDAAMFEERNIDLSDTSDIPDFVKKPFDNDAHNKKIIEQQKTDTDPYARMYPGIAVTGEKYPIDRAK